MILGGGARKGCALSTFSVIFLTRHAPQGTWLGLEDRLIWSRAPRMLFKVFLDLLLDAQ